MQTIVISMDARKLENPDLDIRYSLPERIEAWSEGAVQDNGYDYTDEQGFGLAVWLQTEDAEKWWPKIVERLKSERFCENDLSKTALVLVSQEANAKIETCRQVYPE